MKFKAGLTPLFRPRKGRILFGVCAAFADHYGWNLTLTRVLFTIGAILTRFVPGLLLYGLLFFIIPQGPVTSDAIDVDFEVVES